MSLVFRASQPSRLRRNDLATDLRKDIVVKTPRAYSISWLAHLAILVVCCNGERQSEVENAGDGGVGFMMDAFPRKEAEDAGNGSITPKDDGGHSPRAESPVDSGMSGAVSPDVGLDDSDDWPRPYCWFENDSTFADVNIMVSVVSEETGLPITDHVRVIYWQDFPSGERRALCADQTCQVWVITEPLCGRIRLYAGYLEPGDQPNCYFMDSEMVSVVANPEVSQDVRVELETTAYFRES